MALSCGSHTLSKQDLCECFVKVHLKQNFKKESFWHTQLYWSAKIVKKMSIVAMIPIKLYIFFALLQSNIGFPCLELSFPFLFMQFLVSLSVK